MSLHPADFPKRVASYKNHILFAFAVFKPKFLPRQAVTPPSRFVNYSTNLGESGTRQAVLEAVTVYSNTIGRQFKEVRTPNKKVRTPNL